MCVSLGRHRSFCEVDGQTIILDVRADRYWQLGPKFSAELGRVAQLGDVDRAGELSDLRRAGVLPDPEDEFLLHPCPPLEIAATSVLGKCTTYRLWDGLRALHALTTTMTALRSGLLHFEIDRVRRLKASTAGAHFSAALLPRLCASFNATVRLLGWEGRCLLHGLAIARFLATRGYDVSLAIGVTVRPFSAHCWVQAGDLVLTDLVERVANYTPILVI